MNKKILKIGAISLSSTAIVATPIAFVYGLKLDKKNHKKIIFNEEKINEQTQVMNSEKIENMIISGKLMELNSQDFLTIIKGIKKDQSVLITKLIGADIIKKIKKIDDVTFKMAFDILLHRGLKDMTKNDALKLEKVLQTFLGNNDLVKYIKYLPTIINGGVSELLANKASSNDLMKKIADIIVSITKNEWFEYIKYLPIFIEGGVNKILNDQDMSNEIKQKLANLPKTTNNANIINILHSILNKEIAEINDPSTKKLVDIVKNLIPDLKNKLILTKKELSNAFKILKNGLLKLPLSIKNQSLIIYALWNQAKQFFASLKISLSQVEINNIVKFIDKIFKEGLKNIETYSFVKIYRIVKKLVPSLSTSLSNSQFENIIKILKNGFKSIPKADQVSVIHAIIDQTMTKAGDGISIIKKFIIKK